MIRYYLRNFQIWQKTSIGADLRHSRKPKINTMKIRPSHATVTVENLTGKRKILKVAKEKYHYLRRNNSMHIDILFINRNIGNQKPIE